MTKRLSLQLLLWVLATLMAMTSAMAQNTSAGLSGRVVDAAGNPVADASVEIVHMPSNTSIKVTTNADGRFVAQGLRVGGPFGVSAEKDGATGQKSDVYLQLAQQADITIQLAGATTTLEGVSVTATATSQIFQPDNKGVSTNVSQRELKVIPNADRSIQQIARLDPFIILQNNNTGRRFRGNQRARPEQPLQQRHHRCGADQRRVRPRSQRPAVAEPAAVVRRDRGIQHLDRQLRRDQQARRRRRDQHRHQERQQRFPRFGRTTPTPTATISPATASTTPTSTASSASGPPAALSAARSSRTRCSSSSTTKNPSRSVRAARVTVRSARVRTTPFR